MQKVALVVGLFAACLIIPAASEDCKCKPNAKKPGEWDCTPAHNKCGETSGGPDASFVGSCQVNSVDPAVTEAGYQSECCCVDTGAVPDGDGYYPGTKAENDQHKFGENAITVQGDGFCQRSPNEWDCAVTGKGQCIQNLFWCGPAIASGGGSGDPHFVGFDGTSYDFHGYHNATFNLVTHPSLQVNSYFHNFGIQNMTFIKILSVKYGSDWVMISSRPYVEDKVWKAAMDVELNGRPLQAPYNSTDTTILVEATQGITVKVQVDSQRNYAVKVSTPILDIVSTLMHYNLHLDVSAHLVSKAGLANDLHGVLGQTLGWMEMDDEDDKVVVGSDKDYQVSHILADDFAFNRFTGAQFEDDMPGRVMIATNTLQAVVGDAAAAAKARELLLSGF